MKFLLTAGIVAATIWGVSMLRNRTLEAGGVLGVQWFDVAPVVLAVLFLICAST